MPGTRHTLEGSFPRHSPLEVFRVFLVLGLTSFGGPVAHLGYFRTAIVDRRNWLSDREFGELLTLAQFLPGPASSQLGFMLGIRRAGSLGGIAAFLGFTLPSVALMVAVAFGAARLSDGIGSGLLLGAKVVAVAVVAHAVLGMSRTLTPDVLRASIAVVAAALSLLVPGGQLIAIALGLVVGLLFCRVDPGTTTPSFSGVPNAPAGVRSRSSPHSKTSGAAAPAKAAPAASPAHFGIRTGFGVVCLTLFALLLIGLPLLALVSPEARFFDAFYRSGALVFGGGHVVLPLLQGAVVDPGWVSQSEFLAGYGAAQALPGPLFSFAAFLGAESVAGPGGLAGALLATIAIFLPGFLLVLGVLPFWQRVYARWWSRSAMRGANAAVVGILAAALYDPIFTSGVTSAATFVLALTCFLLLAVWKLPPWVSVAVGLAGGALIAVAN